jgi:CMP-N-acetylneuraminic acid synthetase
LLAQDDTPISSVLSHIIEQQNLQDNVILLLQATSPLRSDQDILSSIKLFGSGLYDLVFTVTEQEGKILKYGALKNNSYIPIADSKFLFQNRQSLPEVYGHNGAVYLFNAKEYLHCGGFPTERIGAVVMPKNRSIDIDDLKSFNDVQSIILNDR